MPDGYLEKAHPTLTLMRKLSDDSNDSDDKSLPSQKDVVQDLRKQLIDSNKLAAQHAAMRCWRNQWRRKKETEVLEEFVEKEVEDMPGEKDGVVLDMQRDDQVEDMQKDEVVENMPAKIDEVEDMLVEKAVKPPKYPFDWNPEGLGPRGKLSGATRLKYKFTKYYPRGASLKKWIEFNKDQKKKD